MVQCDQCDGWFHGECVGVTIPDVADLNQYICPTLGMTVSSGVYVSLSVTHQMRRPVFPAADGRTNVEGGTVSNIRGNHRRRLPATLGSRHVPRGPDNAAPRTGESRIPVPPARLPVQDQKNAGPRDPGAPPSPFPAGGTLRSRNYSSKEGSTGLGPHPPSGAEDLPPGIKCQDTNSGGVNLHGTHPRRHKGGQGRPLPGGWGGTPFHLCPGRIVAPGPVAAGAGLPSGLP